MRYTALVSGIGYGIFHRRTLQAREDKHAQEKAYRHKEELIAKAKEAYKNRLVASKADDGGEFTFLKWKRIRSGASRDSASFIMRSGALGRSRGMRGLGSDRLGFR